jgi:hypothetical protein
MDGLDLRRDARSRDEMTLAYSEIHIPVHGITHTVAVYAVNVRFIITR